MPPGPEAITREQIDHSSGVTGVVQNAKAVNLRGRMRKRNWKPGAGILNILEFHGIMSS